MWHLSSDYVQALEFSWRIIWVSVKLSVALLITLAATVVSRVVTLNVFTYKSDYSLVSMWIWKCAWLMPTIRPCIRLKLYDTELFQDLYQNLELHLVLTSKCYCYSTLDNIFSTCGCNYSTKTCCFIIWTLESITLTFSQLQTPLF